MIERSSPFGRFVLTGSGLTSVLDAVRTPLDGVTEASLWDRLHFINIGQSLSTPAAHDMASAILKSYAAAAQWPPQARAEITAASVVSQLSESSTATHGLAAPRPALLSYMVDFMGSARGGSPAQVQCTALGHVLRKLHQESIRDAAMIEAVKSLR